jgi:hypothetical protein
LMLMQQMAMATDLFKTAHLSNAQLRRLNNAYIRTW